MTVTLLSNDDKLAMMEISSILTVDTEGYSLLGFSVSADGFPFGIYLPFNHATGNLTPEQKIRAFEILNTREALVFHNAAHDLKILEEAGFNYRGKFYDTMLMAHWVKEDRMDYSLDKISQAYGGKPKVMPPQMSMIIESDGWEAVPVQWMDEYSSNDAYITHQLFRKLLIEFQAQGFDGDLWEWEQQFIRDVMYPMMRRGVNVDLAFCIQEYMRGSAIMENCIKELGFKPSSPTALKKFLVDEMGLPVVKHTKACLKCFPLQKFSPSQPVANHDGRASFDKEAMEEYDLMLDKIQDDRAKTILTYRGWQKTNSSNYKSYMDKVDKYGTLHPGYKLHGTKTGRLSCSDPNLQQIPKSSDKDWNGGLKRAFIPREGYELWTIDYSQLQFRMTVAYANQKTLLAIFNDESRDIFDEMAAQMGWLRSNVKTLVYLILFGGGAKRASAAFGVSLAQGGELVNEFHSLYPEIKKVAKQAETAARRMGFVAYWTGRRRHFGRGSAFYRAFNAVIQGGEAEIIKRAMIRLQNELCDENFRMVLQIHDEIAFEIRTGMAEQYLPKAQQIMEDAGIPFCEKIGVHVKFKTQAKRWGEK